MSERNEDSEDQDNVLPKREDFPDTEIKNAEDDQTNYYN